jgi:RNA polymerase-binding transcription factor DksA
VIDWILRVFLNRCAHEHTTWPRKVGFRTYIVCTDCGREIDYDWKEMREVA